MFIAVLAIPDLKTLIPNPDHKTAGKVMREQQIFIAILYVQICLT
jgi:hypothetical protein